jgi:hypothetical protein
MIKAASIDDVISNLDSIIAWSKEKQSRIGYFATLYQKMTKAVRQGIEDNRFANGNRMERLDIIFANRYLHAWEAYEGKEKCSSAWCAAFDACGRDNLIVLQHLILGINTHINLDLGIAAAEACPGNEIHDLEDDFNKINGVIASLMQDVQNDLTTIWPPLGLLARIANHRQDVVLNFSIDTARRVSWQNAVKLATLEGTARDDYEQLMGDVVVHVANRVIDPGLAARFVLSPVLMHESKNVSQLIDILAQ